MGLPDDLVWPVPLDPTGQDGPTAGLARGRDWRRSSHGLYVPADTDQSVEQRIVEAAAVLPAYGGVTGWAGLRWLGGAWFDGTGRGGREQRPVTLATGDRSIRPRPGIAISEERLDPTELHAHRGLIVTTALRSVFFETRYAATDGEAVTVADMAAYADLVSRRDVVEFATVNAGWTGMDRFRLVAEDMDENSWSPAEVTMRRTWEHEAQLPRPLTNRPVFDLTGRHLGTPDLIDPVAGVIGEYNGALHLDGDQRSRDVRREALFREVGLECVEMLAGDLADTTAFIGRVRQAYARAARQPVTHRRWTIALPSWWVPTFTVEQRRALDDSQRQRLLRLRLRAG